MVVSADAPLKAMGLHPSEHGPFGSFEFSIGDRINIGEVLTIGFSKNSSTASRGTPHFSAKAAIIAR